jgi:hypothetical protein
MGVAAEDRRVSLDEAADWFVRSHARKNTNVLREYRLAMDEMKKFAQAEDADLETVAAMHLPELASWAEAAGRRLAPGDVSFEAARRSLEIADIFFRWARRRGYLNGKTEAAENQGRRRPVAVGSYG